MKKFVFILSISNIILAVAAFVLLSMLYFTNGINIPFVGFSILETVLFTIAVSWCFIINELIKD